MKSTYTAIGYDRRGYVLFQREGIETSAMLAACKLDAQLAHPGIARWRVQNEKTGRWLKSGPDTRLVPRYMVDAARQRGMARVAALHMSSATMILQATDVAQTIEQSCAWLVVADRDASRFTDAVCQFRAILQQQADRLRDLAQCTIVASAEAQEGATP